MGGPSPDANMQGKRGLSKIQEDTSVISLSNVFRFWFVKEPERGEYICTILCGKTNMVRDLYRHDRIG